MPSVPSRLPCVTKTPGTMTQVLWHIWLPVLGHSHTCSDKPPQQLPEAVQCLRRRCLQNKPGRAFYCTLVSKRGGAAPCFNPVLLAAAHPAAVLSMSPPGTPPDSPPRASLCSGSPVLQATGFSFQFIQARHQPLPSKVTDLTASAKQQCPLFRWHGRLDGG